MEYLASSRKLIQGEDSRVLSDVPSPTEEAKTERLMTQEDLLHELPNKESRTEEIKVSKMTVEEVK